MREKIERIDDFINYGKLAIVALIILFGADLTPKGLLFLALAIALIVTAELSLLYVKQVYIEEWNAYLWELRLAILEVEKENERNNRAA